MAVMEWPLLKGSDLKEVKVEVTWVCGPQESMCSVLILSG